MNIPVETANAAMSLAGGVLALAAAIIAAVTAILPKEKTIAAIEQLRAKAVSFFTVSSAAAASASVFFFDAPCMGLFFIIVCASLISFDYLRRDNPATRTETFVLIMQIAIVLAFAFLFFLSRVVALLEKHA